MFHVTARLAGMRKAQEFIIAAAPELLAACKSALNWAQGNTAATREEGDARLAEMLRAAIAKAEAAERWERD